MNALKIRYLGTRRHAKIQSDWAMHTDKPFEEVYVDFSGFFGAYNPKLFARAPEMLEALERARVALRFAAEHSPAMQDDYNAICALIDEVKA
jgi:hypothetical protein